MNIQAGLDVLVVDDDPDINQILSDLLVHEGYQAQVARTGTEAITKGRQQHFGAVFLDLGLPDIDGITVLQSLLEIDPSLPVIVLTAYKNDEKMMSCLSKGAFAYLTKPFNAAELKATLRRAVGVKDLAVKVERAENALNESEERFRAVAQSANDAIILADEAGNIISWNKAAERFFNYAEEEVLGRPLTFIMPGRYRDAHLKGLDRLRSKGEVRVLGKTIEVHGLRKDGSEFPLELSLSMGKTKTGTFYSAIIRDSTDRKRVEEKLRESEERFRQLAENIREVFWLSDPEKNQILYISPGYEEIWGRSCESLYSSPRSWLDAIHPDDRDRVLAAALTKQIDGQYDEQYRIVRPDGSVRWIRDRAFPVKDPAGTIYRVAGIAEDITEQKAGVGAVSLL
jgi:PAS domain S-box-containing protein